MFTDVGLSPCPSAGYRMPDLRPGTVTALLSSNRKVLQTLVHMVIIRQIMGWHGN